MLGEDQYPTGIIWLDGRAKNNPYLLQEPSEPPPKATKTPEPARAEAKTIPALKTSDTPTVKSIPAKIQEPMYTKAATPKVNKVRSKKKSTY